MDIDLILMSFAEDNILFALVLPVWGGITFMRAFNTDVAHSTTKKHIIEALYVFRLID